MQTGGFAAEHRLLLFDVIVDGTVGLHLLDLLQPTERPLNRLQIGEGATQPAFRDIKLAAGFGGFFDRLLRLLFGADEQHAPALADGAAEKIAHAFDRREGLAEVDDVDSVAGIEDEFLHLGIPTFGLVSEVDARFQQFFNANT